MCYNYTHTHTHTHVYIYIHQVNKDCEYPKNERSMHGYLIQNIPAVQNIYFCLKTRNGILFINFLFFKQIASSLKIVDFLDVTLNLNNGIFKPFSKNNSAPTYVNIDSNHPRSLLKQIPNAVKQRINRLSLCKRIHEESKSIYDEAFKNSGFQGRLEYVNLVKSESNGNNSCGTGALVKVGDTNNNHSNRRGKNRKVIWSNPPFCKHTNINILPKPPG